MKNLHIEIVRKWLADRDSVSYQDLAYNKRTAEMARQYAFDFFTATTKDCFTSLIGREAHDAAAKGANLASIAFNAAEYAYEHSASSNLDILLAYVKKYDELVSLDACNKFLEAVACDKKDQDNNQYEEAAVTDRYINLYRSFNSSGALVGSDIYPTPEAALKGQSGCITDADYLLIGIVKLV